MATADQRTTRLLRGDAPGGPLVPAVVHLDFTAERLPAVEASWAESRAALRAGTAEHWHWNWRLKELRAYRLLGLEADGAVQGLMAISRHPRPSVRPRWSLSRLLRPTGGTCLYVQYLEVAPWNLVGDHAPPRLTGVGSALMIEAFRESIKAGCEGRVGLHALPQAEPFYRNRCGMDDRGVDPQEDLRYFESTPERAAAMIAARRE